MTLDIATAKAALRKTLREKRRLIPSSIRQAASQALAQRVIAHPYFKQAQKIACYSATPEEIDPNPIIQAALEQGKSVYLPVMPNVSSRLLRFLLYTNQTLMKKNRVGILEPQAITPPCSLESIDLDLVLMPLVGFDETGNRLGMGKGYYDTTLGRLPKYNLPKLLGLAFECQKVDAIPIDKNDVKLSAVVTEVLFYPAK